MWDIYDYSPDDYSTYMWPPHLPPHPNPQASDSVGDSLYLGYQDIVDVLLNRQVGGHQCDSILDFWDAWFQSPSKGHEKAMLDIFYEHGINKIGDANNDENVNMGDVTFLINYVLKAGPSPVPVLMGDCNCDRVVNIGDPVYLISYIYKSGPAPCPIY